jgi:methylmalonyl-CoA mutase C-terminal domain/subunit
MIAETAVQEDVDCIGLSILSGAHMTLFPRILSLLGEKGVGDVPVFGGGIIPDDDIRELKRLGVREIFTPGASTHQIIDWIKENVPSHT